jgi:hypothetical protein
LNPETLKSKNLDILYVWIHRIQGYVYVPYSKYLKTLKEKEDKLKREAEEAERVKRMIKDNIPKAQSYNKKKSFNKGQGNKHNFNNGQENNNFKRQSFEDRVLSLFSKLQQQSQKN